MKFIKKINLKIVLLEVLASTFLIHGIQRLYVASQGKEYDALVNMDFDKFETLTSQRVGDFFMSRFYWTLYAFIFLTLFIFLLNRKFNIHYINSILNFVIVFTLFPLGFFFHGFANNYLNYFCRLFGEKHGLSFFIGGTILCIIGFLILSMVIKQYQKVSIILK
ncbi:hypothetical protein [Sinomicrobium sp. M5D2P9]